MLNYEQLKYVFALFKKSCNTHFFIKNYLIDFPDSTNDLVEAIIEIHGFDRKTAKNYIDFILNK